MKKKKVAIVLFKEKEKILIQDRRPWDKYGFDYGFFGGKIESNETPEETLKREIKEELNLKIKDIKFLKHTKKQIPKIDLEIEFYAYESSIPNMNKLICKEGKPFLTDIKTALKLKFNPADLELLNEIYKKNQKNNVPPHTKV